MASTGTESCISVDKYADLEWERDTLHSALENAHRALGYTERARAEWKALARKRMKWFCLTASFAGIEALVILVVALR